MPRPRKAASGSDATAATTSPSTSSTGQVALVDTSKYSYEQVFYSTELWFYWKLIPDTISNPLQGGDLISLRDLPLPKNKIPLELCFNASGNCVLKPMLLFTVNEINWLRRNDDLTKLPVHWKAYEKTKGIITDNLFEVWFNNFFAVDVEKYLNDKKLPVKAVLIVDGSSGHSFIDHPNIEMRILPSGNVMKPVNNVLISQLKEGYNTLFLDKLEKFIKASKPKTSDIKNLVQTFIDGFSLKDGIELIGTVVKNFQSAAIYHVWQKILPEESTSKAIEIESKSVNKKNKRQKIK